MNKELNALDLLLDCAIEESSVGTIGGMLAHSRQYEGNKAIVEQALIDYQKQKDYIEVLEDRVNNIETTYVRKNKALKIFVEKQVQVDWLLYCIKHGNNALERYNNAFVQSALTQEEFNILAKAVQDYE